MDEPLETELRKVLASRAAEVPADAVERLRQADYRPRDASRDASPRWRAGRHGAVGAGVAAAVLVIGAAPAFAGWTAVPADSAPPAIPAAHEGCEASLAAFPTAPRLVDARRDGRARAVHACSLRELRYRRDLPHRTVGDCHLGTGSTGWFAVGLEQWFASGRHGGFELGGHRCRRRRRRHRAAVARPPELGRRRLQRHRGIGRLRRLRGEPPGGRR